MTKFIEPYNPDWKTAFEKIKQVLKTVLGNSKADIQHVGSTAIPGLYAKPVLDIDIIIENKNLLNDITAQLEETGYKSKGQQGIAGRFAFRQTSEYTPFTTSRHKWQPHHLYVCYADSLALKNHILFRDSLINDKDLIEKYSNLKKSLTDNMKITREVYTTKKTDFIITVLAAAGLSEQELNDITNANT